MTSPRRRTILTAFLAGGLVTACTDQSGAPQGADGASSRAGGASSGGDDAGAGAADPGTAVVTSTFMLAQTKATVGARPLVRVGENLVLTLDLSTEATASDVEDQEALSPGLAAGAAGQWGDGWGSASGDTRDYFGVRLVDLENDMVASTAVDAEGQTVGLDAEEGEDGSSDGAQSQAGGLRGTVQIAFADPGTDSLCVYVPKLPLFTDVPVIDAEVPAVEGAEEQLDLSRIEEAPLEPIQSMSQDLEEPIRQKREVETTTVAISSDVLFEATSADLDAKAKSALDEAARQIQTHEAGPVTITGHTDSVDSDDYNLTLSKKRAKAVATALGERLDTTEYELSTEGKGESEPVASNDTAEGKALNRRVEIVLETPVKADEAEKTEMPEFEGHTGSVEDGVSFDGSEYGVLRPFDLQLSAARMIEGHLVVTLEVTPLDDSRNGVYGIGQFDTGTGLPEEPDGVSDYTLLASCGAVGVLVGSVITYPALHRAGGQRDTIRPLTDLSLNSAADGGTPRTLELVYPRDIVGVAEGEQVVLQYGGTSSLDFDNEAGWRLTDVPIST